MKKEIKDRQGERGSAMVIAILIMALLSIFVAVALARVTTESLIMGNESDEQKTTYAAQASLETMTRNFNKIFDLHLTPSDDDLASVKSKTPPGFDKFTFSQNIIKKTDQSQRVNISGGTFQGLSALQDPWQIQTTATSASGQQVMLTRDFLNNRVPIFQFGMFFDGDLEVASGSTFSFGGRVHTNGDLYLRGGGKTTFDSRVSSSGEVVIDKARNGWDNDVTKYSSAAGFGDKLYIKDASGTEQQLKLKNGSVLGGPDIAKTNPDVPDGDLNTLWKSSYADHREDCRLINDIFGGNLVAKAKKLVLPLKIGGGATNNIEMIKRGVLTGDYENTQLGRAVDNQILAFSRYSNKPGIRISLADSQSELPGKTGGVRLDGAGADGFRGYQPVAMKDGYQATRVNGYRLYTGASYTDNGTGCPLAGCTPNSTPANRENWIKVEIVTLDTSTLLPVTQDITADFLSLGVTEKAPTLPASGVTKGNDFSLNAAYYTNNTDSRSILKLQRFAIPGSPIRDNAGNNSFFPTVVTSKPKWTDPLPEGPINYTWTTTPQNSSLPTSFYYVKWTGKVKAWHSIGTTARNYKFVVNVNDGARVTVGGNVVIDSWTEKSSTTKVTSTINVSLTPNQVKDIVVEYFQNDNSNGAAMELRWIRPTTLDGSGSSTVEETVPLAYLYTPTADTNLVGLGLKGEYYTRAYTYVAGSGGVSCVTDDDYLMPNESNFAVAAAKIKEGSTTFTDRKVLPIPIEMFDAREGLDNEFYGSTSPYRNTGAVPYLGVMSMIDIDVANLKKFLDGTWDGQFPSGLKASQIPKDSGWVMYVSDRRGDRSFDGQFDMEDVYGSVKADGSLDATHVGPNDGVKQFGEDVNLNGVLDVDYSWEATKYRETSVSTDRAVDPVQIVQPTTTTTYISANSDLAAIFDHKYYRRGVRLINASRLPGDKNNGFTLASENGVYIFGDYNATGVSSHDTPTAADNYQPDADNGQVPASIVADAVTIISNPALTDATGWTDGTSFRRPDDGGSRLPKETTVRTALLMGNSISGMYNDTYNQGGLYSQNLNGTISNFKRFLEVWNGEYLNYCGSLINLFNSQNNVGTFKYGQGTVYSAPTRNWVFDTSFLDATRLPPGTPFFQYVQMTGFRRMNN